MANITKPRKALSDWLEYKLDTTDLVPPVLRLRIGLISSIVAMLDTFGAETRGRYVADAVLAAVEDWDLAIDGEKLPVTAENKRAYLLPLLGAKVEGIARALPLGIELFNFANNEENFLKN